MLPFVTRFPIRLMLFNGPCSLTLPFALAIILFINDPQKPSRNSMFVFLAPMFKSI